MPDARGNLLRPRTNYARNPMQSGLLTANPNNVQRSPENIQRRQGMADAIGGFFTQNPNNVQRSPESIRRRQAIASFFGAQQQQSPYQQYGDSLPSAGVSEGAMDQKRVNPMARLTMPNVFGTTTEGMDQKRIGPLAGLTMPNNPPASTFVNPMPSGRIPMPPLARNAQPQGNPFMDDQQAAMAEQGLMDRMNALTARSQSMNPMGMAAQGQTSIDQYRDPRMDAMMAQEAARQQNTPQNPFVGEMNDPSRRTPEMTQRLGESAVGYRMAGGVAADPTNGRSRFTGDNPLAENTAEYARGLQGVAAGEGVMIQPGGRGSNSQYLGFNNTRAGAEQAALASAGPTNAGVRAYYDNPVLKQKQADFAASKKAKEEQFMQETGMNYAQARRAEKTAKRQDAIFQRRVKSGMNPMSPSAFAAFPEAAGRFQDAYANRGKGGAAGAQNPMAPTAAGPRTVETQMAAAERIQTRESSSPHMTAIGVQPGTGLAGLNTAMQARLKEDPSASFSDESLKEYQQQAQDYSTLSTDQNDQFNLGDTPFDQYRSTLWKELAGLPDNPRARAEWLKKFRGSNNAVTGATTDPTVGNTPYFPPGTPVGR